MKSPLRTGALINLLSLMLLFSLNFLTECTFFFQHCLGFCSFYILAFEIYLNLYIFFIYRTNIWTFGRKLRYVCLLPTLLSGQILHHTCEVWLRVSARLLGPVFMACLTFHSHNKFLTKFQMHDFYY